jgi:hypothetical protein
MMTRRENMSGLRGVEYARLLLDEAEGHLARGDAVQSSEELYKAAEERDKALSERFSPPRLGMQGRRVGGPSPCLKEP